MMPDQTADEIANEVRMRAIEHKGLFVVVEGSTDERLLKGVLNVGDTVFVPSTGYANVVGAINVLTADNFTKALGIIDRDYHGIHVPPPASPNIIMTDDRDIEVFLFNSSTLEKVLTELGSAPKLAKESGGIAGLRDRVFAAAYPVAMLRFISAKGGGTYSFRKLDFDKFVARKTLDLNRPRLVAHFRGCAERNAKVPDNILDLAQAEIEKINPAVPRDKFCRGHDLFAIAAIGLRNLWGNYSSAKMTGEQLESIIRLACVRNEFRASPFALRIIAWFAQHKVVA